ncbi:hypothetical protein HXX76_003802 [Chlamydomonas incerta]|uniref:FCP1 homology domain-containing protein n=1 Tax=Chlamydomonas incerta TaxID=51695 RepID=A0A835T8V1_CHLIN|nr:hypothetical protein HXX76_003802 [Chlamydomonas incerta]|eukprot:KAG2440949.1 hypothetical protein HXX76_003802 [Chlamydomonas incerta]
MLYGSSEGSENVGAAEAAPPPLSSELAPAPGGAGNEDGDDDCGESPSTGTSTTAADHTSDEPRDAGTDEEIEEEPDCASDQTPDDTTTSSTTATDATSADGSPSESEPLTPTTPQRLPFSAPLLPPADDPSRMTLVLDLDGTLIASEDEPHAPVPFDYCVDEERFVWLRPGLRRFLESVRPLFEVVLFTAAGESWATCAMQRIDPDGRIFDSRLYRDHTVSHDDWPWVKDLSRLGRDLARVVIVDDNPLMFMYQPDNALHVAPYDPQVTGHRDDVLEQVLDVLMHKVLPADDVREVLKHLKDPVSPSCVASRRHVATKPASGASGVSVLKSFLRTNHVVGGRPSGGSSGSSSNQQASMPRRRGGSSQGDAAAAQGAAGHFGAGSTGQSGDGHGSRRARRGAKDGQRQGQPQQQQQQPLQSGLQAQEQGPQVASGGSSVQHKRRSRSRRQAAKSNDGAAAAQPSVQQQQQPAPQAQTQKQAQSASRRAAVVAQQSASTALQQPDKQLQLKLRLLQLQREQEAEEVGIEAGADGRSSAAGGAALASSSFLGPRLYSALAALAKDEGEDDVLEGTIRGGRTVVGRVPVLPGLGAAESSALMVALEEVTAPAPQTARQALQPPKATPLPMPSAWGRPPHRPWGVAPSAAPSAAGSPERSTLTSSTRACALPSAAAASAAARPLNYAAVVAGHPSTRQRSPSVEASARPASLRASFATDVTAEADSAAEPLAAEPGPDAVSSPRRRSRGRRGRRGRKTAAGADSDEVAQQLSS